MEPHDSGPVQAFLDSLLPVVLDAGRQKHHRKSDTVHATRHCHILITKADPGGETGYCLSKNRMIHPAGFAAFPRCSKSEDRDLPVHPPDIVVRVGKGKQSALGDTEQAH
jgi:hypothetical protein